LENLPEFQSANIIFLYWSLPNEVDTQVFIEKWSVNKTILLPVIENDAMILKCYTDNACLVTGKFNICEPDTATFTDYSRIDLCVVPGLAFDKHGNRLGKGKGFYDKFLSNINAMKIGICFDVQYIDNIPHDDWDQKMDLIVHP
jgi:5-formyltetrahydrofolate cyclo-ligase